MQNPLAKQRALMSLRGQAAEWLTAFRRDLLSRGLGFTADDVAAVEVSHQAHPAPTQRPGPLTYLKVIWVGIKATVQRYPSLLREDDARLAPVAGFSFPAYAVAAAAIGWATDDAALVDRVTRALGLTPDAWATAIEGWTERIEDDVVIATMYGQLFAQVGQLPLRGSPAEEPDH